MAISPQDLTEKPIGNLLIAAFDDPIRDDLATYLRDHTNISVKWWPESSLVETAFLVCLLPRHFEANQIDALTEVVQKNGIRRVLLISSDRVHFGDQQLQDLETQLAQRFHNLGCQVTILRPSRILSPKSPTQVWLRNRWYLYPLVPGRLRSCFLDGNSLFATIVAEVTRTAPRQGAIYTLLGTNYAWRDVMHAQSGTCPIRRSFSFVNLLLSLLCIGHLAAWGLQLLTWIFPSLRRIDFDTLTPTSQRELLALYNPYNYKHVKIVGYNNGVVHFGQRHPGKTIVSTARIHQKAKVLGKVAQFDAGVTVGLAVKTLTLLGKELPVIPNYSYVCMGTAFFIPIHGSASEYPTLGDTIVKVLLYDPVRDRFLIGDRESEIFRDAIYNLKSPLLLLRLWVQVQDKARYFMLPTKLEQPTGQQILDLFNDPKAANIEIRQKQASDPSIDVRKYYTEPPQGSTDALPFPKDSLGRLWDRLEENPVTSYLFHWAVRRFIHHVELFISPEEFPKFWETHGSLPISKIQLRSIRRDGLPHSPFRDHDCISADLMMRRKHKPVFDAYLKENFRGVQFNPGKHSH